MWDSNLVCVSCPGLSWPRCCLKISTTVTDILARKNYIVPRIIPAVFANIFLCQSPSAAGTKWTPRSECFRDRIKVNLSRCDFRIFVRLGSVWWKKPLSVFCLISSWGPLLMRCFLQSEITSCLSTHHQDVLAKPVFYRITCSRVPIWIWNFGQFISLVWHDYYITFGQVDLIFRVSMCISRGP